MTDDFDGKVKDLYAELHAAAPPVPRLRPPVTPPPRPWMRRTVLAGAATAAVVVIGVGLASLSPGGDSSATTTEAAGATTAAAATTAAPGTTSAESTTTSQQNASMALDRACGAAVQAMQAVDHPPRTGDERFEAAELASDVMTRFSEDVHDDQELASSAAAGDLRDALDLATDRLTRIVDAGRAPRRSYARAVDAIDAVSAEAAALGVGRCADLTATLR